MQKSTEMRKVKWRINQEGTSENLPMLLVFQIISQLLEILEILEKDKILHRGFIPSKIFLNFQTPTVVRTVLGGFTSSSVITEEKDFGKIDNLLYTSPLIDSYRAYLLCWRPRTADEKKKQLPSFSDKTLLKIYFIPVKVEEKVEEKVEAKVEAKVEVKFNNNPNTLRKTLESAINAAFEQKKWDVKVLIQVDGFAPKGSQGLRITLHDMDGLDLSLGVVFPGIQLQKELYFVLEDDDKKQFVVTLTPSSEEIFTPWMMVDIVS